MELSGLDERRHLDYGGKYSKTHLPQNTVRALGHLSISCDARLSHFSRKEGKTAPCSNCSNKNELQRC